MKKIIGLVAVGLVLLTAAFTLGTNSDTDLELGERSPAFSEQVTNLDNETKILREYIGNNGILVVFSCNTCPFVIAWEDRYNELDAFAKEHGVNMVLVNSNEAYRSEEDSFSEMKIHAEELGYTMPYVIDHNSAIADAFGAVSTPHVFLFDGEMRLRYRGAIDDNRNKEDARIHYAKDAIQEMSAGQEVSTPETKAMGCSIKRKK